MTALELLEKIKEIVITASKQPLSMVQHQPEANARSLSCFHNVWEKIDRDGGEICFGWTFNYRVNPQSGDYLVATHHAVWLTLDKMLIDVTPFHENPQHKPFAIADKVIFLVDTSAKPTITPYNIVPLPLRFYPLTNDSQLIKYLDYLTEKEHEAVEEIKKDNFDSNQIIGYIKL